MSIPIKEEDYEAHRVRDHGDGRKLWVWRDRTGLPITTVCGQCWQVVQARHEVKIVSPFKVAKEED